jgi:hypothetical protein
MCGGRGGLSSGEKRKNPEDGKKASTLQKRIPTQSRHSILALLV